MKQTMQQTVVQRAMQPSVRPSPSGPETFDMGDEDDEDWTLKKGDVELEAPSFTRMKERERVIREREIKSKSDEAEAKRARLASIGEEAVSTPDQTADMVASSSAAAASSSGYGSAAAADTDEVSVRVRAQALEEQIQGNLRGGVVAKPTTSTQGNLRAPRYDWRQVAQHRRSDSETSTASAVSAASAVSTATTVAIPKQMRAQIDIDIVLAAALDRRIAWNKSNDIDKVEISMEISTLMRNIEKSVATITEINTRIKSKIKYKTKAAESKDRDTVDALSKAYVVSKKRLMDIMELPE